MFPIVRLIGALCPREIPDGAGEAANPPHQGKILKIQFRAHFKLHSNFNSDKGQGHPRTKTLPTHLPP